MNFRKMTSADVPVSFEIAIAGREKSFTREGLYAAGITEEFVVEALDGDRSVEGWACECDGRVVGVAMGNKTNGEFWVMVVLPEYEKRGIGFETLRFNHRLAGFARMERIVAGRPAGTSIECVRVLQKAGLGG